MPISYQEQAELTCPACGKDFHADVWLVLDAAEQPAEATALREGQLNAVICPHCGHSGPAGAPLLYHDAALRQVIFAASPGAEEHEWREQARDLHLVLVGSIAEAQRRAYLSDVEIAQDLAGIAKLIARAERRAGGRKAAPPVETTTKATAEASGQDDDTPKLLLAVQALLEADGSQALDQVLRDYSLLLEPETEATLIQLANVATEQREYEIAESLVRARQLLSQMRSGAVSGITDVAAEQPTIIATIPETVLQNLLQVCTSAELLALTERHTLLLRPEVDVLLTEQVNLALDEDNERLAQMLEERREALLELRSQVVQGQPVAIEPTLEEAIEALLITEDEAAMAAVITAYPVLLEDVATQALWQFAAEARASDDEEMAVYAIECREMLRRVREGLA